MKKGFTLLELIVVIIVLGILATLALTQYGRTIERARGAEGRSVIGGLRGLANARYMETGNIATASQADLGIGPSPDQAPNTCKPSHYFTYGAVISGTSGVTFVSTRCTSGGKTPNNPVAQTLWLISNLASGVETWTSTSQY